MPLDTKRIKQLRLKLGLSQDDAAHRAKLSGKQAWSRIENGGQPKLGLHILEQVAHALEVHPRDLLK